MPSRTATAIAGLLISVLVSLVAWVVFDFPFLFLFVPFIPFLFRRGKREEPPVRACPECGFTTRNRDFTYCPRDGTPLEGDQTKPTDSFR